MTSQELENKLINLKIKGKYIKTISSGFYTDHYILFDNNVTINKIKARKNDLDFIFNQNVIIEPSYPHVIFRLQNTSRDTIQLSLFQEYIVNHDKPCLSIGMNENNNPIFCDLDKLPHLLVGGTTGSGKSIFLHDCILSLMFNNKTILTLIDPKKSEFSIYKNVSCIDEIITEPTVASEKLQYFVNLMDYRYSLLESKNCRTINEYNNLVNDKNKLYTRVIIIDEFSDLVMQDKTIKDSIIRLAQKSRAVNIHLIIATQRPDSKTVDGLIKANFPSRLCFSVASKIDSRIILDISGGETLRGQGDGLFKPIGQNITHIQAPFITQENIIKYLDSYRTLSNSK